MLAQRYRCTLVEENAHSGGFQGTGRVLQHVASLLQANAWKPGHEIRELSAILQILKKGRYGDTRAPKHPGAADALRVTLNSRTR